MLSFDWLGYVMSDSNIAKSTVNKGIGDNKTTHKKSGSIEKTAQKLHGNYSKGDLRHWLTRVRRVDSPDYGVQILFRGERRRFPLETSNKEAAAKKALAIYQTLRANGWVDTLAKFKPSAAKVEKGSTVGELFIAVAELANVRPTTLRSYITSFRRIVADVMSLELKAGRYARCGSGRKAWLAAVDAVPLEKLTPDRIEAWKLRYVSTRALGDELKARSARNSANSFLRMGKGLFSKKLIQHIEARIKLPAKLPFDGVGLFPRQSMRYVSTMDAKAVLVAARDELVAHDVEAFKAFTLCLLGGLRRNEADKLRWSSVDFDAGVIRVEARVDFAPKAEACLDDVPIDEDVCAILRGLRAREPMAEYVLAADVPKRKFKQPSVSKTPMKRNYAWYRAAATFSRLLKWLREHGVNAAKPLHTLRKEAGSLICEEHGLFASSRFLRHADVAITAQHYAARKQRVTVGLGSVLASGGGNVLPFSSQPEVKPVTSKAATHAKKAGPVVS
jgi:integrase